MSENDQVRTRTVKCPTCNGSISFPVGRNKATCPYCGNEVAVDEPGWLGALDKFDMKLQDAQAALDNKEWDKAQLFFEECARMDDSDPRPWKGIIEAKTRDLTALKGNTEPNFHCYLNRSNKRSDDPFVQRYKDYLGTVSDNDASKAYGNAKENIEYFKRVIEGYSKSIEETKENIQEIKNRPTMETAEKKYSGAKSSLIVNTIFMFLAPVAAAGFVILAIVLLVKAVQGDAHIGGVIASVIAALIFALITKLSWKFHRRTVNSFKTKRVAKLNEDEINNRRTAENNDLAARKTADIEGYKDSLEVLNKAIEATAQYLAIDREKRIDFFLKKHLDAAGFDNGITLAPELSDYIEKEKAFSTYPGYKPVTARSQYYEQII